MTSCWTSVLVLRASFLMLILIFIIIPIRRTTVAITLRVMFCDSTSTLCPDEHRVVVG